jgi:hypothetical protein
MQEDGLQEGKPHPGSAQAAHSAKLHLSPGIVTIVVTTPTDAHERSRA